MIFACSDIFILPSRAEGMSNALIEAMSCGLPCIVSNIPANTQLITNGENGLVVSLDDQEALAEAIIQLTQDEDLRQKLGQAATQTVASHYSINIIAERYLAVYEQLLSNKPS